MWLESSRWLPYLPVVYRVAGSSASLHQYLMGACLWGGPVTVVSHRAAAALFGLQGVAPGIVEITTTTAKKAPTPRIKLHRVKSFDDIDLSVRHGIRVTSVARTIIDLASVVPPKDLEKALNHALRFRMTSASEVEDRLRSLGSRGRRGADALLRLIADRQSLHQGSASDAEDDFISFLRWSRLPEPVGQFPIHDEEGKFVMRCDFAYPDERVAIEIDSHTFHSEMGDRARDHTKRRKATALGWLVVPATRRDMGPDRRKLAHDLRRILAARRPPRPLRL